jgi:hypothetical protein
MKKDVFKRRLGSSKDLGASGTKLAVEAIGC